MGQGQQEEHISASTAGHIASPREARPGQQTANYWALAAFNFLVAAVQTGFGPYISLVLIRAGWSQAEVGIVLSIGTATALLCQLPGGLVVDAVHNKKLILSAAMLITGGTAVVLGTMPKFVPVAGAQILHAAVATVITPSIAALTLGVCGHGKFGVYLGNNTRWQSLGSAFAAVTFGLVALWFSSVSVFLAAAALAIPAILVLRPIKPMVVPEADHPALLRPVQRRRRGHRFWKVFLVGHLHVFAVCVLLFQLADATMLPLAVNALAKRTGPGGLVVSGAILSSQLMVAALSPLLGRAAERRGRKPILLLGFAALPVRGVLLALLPGSIPLILVQALDGISGAVMGIMIPLIAADITRRTAFLNLAINSLALAGGIGATISTFAGGFLADRVGTSAALLGLAAIGLSAGILLYLFMPETKPLEKPHTRPDPANTGALGRPATRMRRSR